MSEWKDRITKLGMTWTLKAEPCKDCGGPEYLSPTGATWCPRESYFDMEKLRAK